jgi:hypothetical protein
MFLLLLWVILSITFCVWRFDVRVVIIVYIVDHVLCLEETQNVIDNITHHSNKNIQPPNTERDR